MAEKTVLVGILPEAIVIEPGDHAVWVSGAGNIRVEFDPNRCPFGSNVFQAPPGMRLSSGPPHPEAKPGSYKYRIALNDQVVATGEVILRAKP